MLISFLNSLAKALICQVPFLFFPLSLCRISRSLTPIASIVKEDPEYASEETRSTVLDLLDAHPVKRFQILLERFCRPLVDNVGT